ncbi:tandem C2 domains nuclear protein [Aplochiton taeniatus]
MAMECIKNCCKSFMVKEEPETPVIKMKMPPAHLAVQGRDIRKGVSEDYLLSKLPPDGRVVPFVLPTFKPSYIQPRGAIYPPFQSGLQSSARNTYAERKAELVGSNTCDIYNPDCNLPHGRVRDSTPPGTGRSNLTKTKTSSPRDSSFDAVPPPGWDLKRQRLSSSMFDLTNPQSHMQRFDSVSSVQSSTSSMSHSIESSRSLESITLSGDERELGKVCVRLSYQEAVEQVWITLVQCSDLNLSTEGIEEQKIGFKGIITLAKPIQFKSSAKEISQDTVFMETFVFALRLQQLRGSALVLRLQTRRPRKRTMAECVLSLRQLGPTETEHWLDLSPPSKSSVCHSELHLATCFQPVNGRIQLQVLAAQNLPVSLSPLTQTFFVKAEIHQLGQVVMKKKTRPLKSSGGQCCWSDTFHFPLAIMDQSFLLSVKLYSRSSVRRKQFLGRVHLGSDSPLLEAAEQWRDTMAHPEKVVSAWHRVSGS